MVLSLGLEAKQVFVDAVQRAADDDAIRAVVLTRRGRVSSAGEDLAKQTPTFTGRA